MYFCTCFFCSNHESTPSSYVELPCCRAASTAANRVHADQSATTQGSGQNRREPACRRASSARGVLKTNQEIKPYPAETIQPQAAAAGDARRSCLYLFPISKRYNTLLSLSYILRSTYDNDACMLRPDCFPGAWLSRHVFKSSVCT